MATVTSTTTAASRTTTAPPLNVPTTTRTTTTTTATTTNPATLTKTSAALTTSRATTAASTTRGTASAAATTSGSKTTISSTSTPSSAALANSAPSTIAGISTTLFIAGAVVVGLVVLAVVGLVIFARTGRSAKQKRIAAAKKAAKEYVPPDPTSQWPTSNKISSMGRSAPTHSLNRSVYNGNDYNGSMPRGYTRASTATSVSSHSSGAALYQNAAPPGFGYVVVQSAPPPNQMYASQPYPMSVTPIPPPSQYASSQPYYALPPNQFPAQPPLQQGYAISDYGGRGGGDDWDDGGTRYGSNERRYAPRGDSRYKKEHDGFVT
ncbi:hypothetical protein BJ742DRAFT_294927 [Cladochytrium replicatum]|nr:hypothetical protein BJ742DRAFT_294927 [Cladochytrium replicatum]